MYKGNHCFRIQISNPQLTYHFDSENDTITSAIEDLFPFETENAILGWNFVRVSLEYKYDVAYLYEDFRYIISFLEENKEDFYSVTFADDTFFAEWNITVCGSQLVIDAKWFRVGGNLEEILNQRSPLIIEKEEFLKELKKMINFVDKCLIECGYKNLLISLYGEQNF